MDICLNEVATVCEEGTTVAHLMAQRNKQANVYSVNGYPVGVDYVLQEGDRLVLIQKGQMPSMDEVEAMIQARHTPGVYEALKKKKVLIIGLGGLGSSIAISLARVGVGTIIGVDYDVVEPSNLNRQQYFIRHIGMKKTEAMAEIIGDINPFIQFVPYDCLVTPKELERLTENINIVIEAVDKDETKAMLVETILTQYHPLKIISGSGMAGYFDSNSITTRRMNDRFYVCGDGINAAKPGSGLMAPRVGIAANHQANLAVQLLLEEEGIR